MGEWGGRGGGGGAGGVVVGCGGGSEVCICLVLVEMLCFGGRWAGWLTVWVTRIRNKAKLKAVELVDPRNTELRGVLRKAEFASMAGDDVVHGEEEDGGPTGSASDSE